MPRDHRCTALKPALGRNGHCKSCPWPLSTTGRLSWATALPVKCRAGPRLDPGGAEAELHGPNNPTCGLALSYPKSTDLLSASPLWNSAPATRQPLHWRGALGVISQ